jgi:hypothetical protein
LIEAGAGSLDSGLWTGRCSVVTFPKGIPAVPSCFFVAGRSHTMRYSSLLFFTGFLSLSHSWIVGGPLRSSRDFFSRFTLTLIFVLIYVYVYVFIMPSRFFLKYGIEWNATLKLWSYFT